MKFQTRIIPVCIVVFCCMGLAPLAMAASYGGGSGTAEDPFQIQTPEQMNAIGANPADWGMSFKLMADIDMAAYTGTAYTIIGNATTFFTGTFDGNGHVIKNLTYSTTNAVDYVGVFGYVFGGTIRNLGVENVSLSTAGSWVGGLVGHKDGTVTGCFATGSVSGSWAIGGLVGNNESGSIEDCYAIVSVNSSGAFSGGLVGRYWVGDIVRCYSVGPVNGVSYVGGFVGWNSIGTFTACFWDTQTSGQNMGLAYGPSDGLAGKTTEEMKTLSTFASAGWDFAYDDGNAAVWQIPANDYPRLDWQFLFGGGSGTAEDPYLIWTPQQMNAIGTNSNQWDKCFKLMADLDMSAYTGTQYNIIGQRFYFTGTFDGNGHVIRNLTYTTTESKDNVGLFGKINGATIKNLGLENVSILSNGDYVGGLVGLNMGTITSCYATGSVSGNTSVGILAGYDASYMDSCHAAGTASCSGYGVGGLVGYNGGSASIKSCYAAATVSGSNAGGLVGINDQVITSSYATGDVNGPGGNGGLVGGNRGTITSSYATTVVNSYGYSAGGLAGLNFGTITSCYATGVVSGYEIGGLVGSVYSSTINDCFWDIQTSGLTDGVGSENPDPAGVTGKTTAEMKALATFTAADWDFLDTWEMIEGLTYPVLRKYSSTDFNHDGRTDIADFAIFAGHWMEGVNL